MRSEAINPLGASSPPPVTEAGYPYIQSQHLHGDHVLRSWMRMYIILQIQQFLTYISTDHIRW